VLHTAYSFSLLTDKYGPEHVRKTLGDFNTRGPQNWPSWAFSNHDARRVASRWSPDKTDKTHTNEAQIKMLHAQLGALRGTVFVYQGEELGLSDVAVPFEKMKDPLGISTWPADVGRDGCRTPMPWESAKPNAGFSTTEPWLPVPPDHQKNSVDVQEKSNHSPLHFFRNFTRWRKQNPSLVTGDVKFLPSSDPVLAFTRDKILAVFNMGDKTETYILPGGTKELQGHGLPYEVANDRLTLPPFGGFFGEIK